MEKVLSRLKEEFSYKNIHEVPKIEKVVVNCGMGDAEQNSKGLEAAIKDNIDSLSSIKIQDKVDRPVSTAIYFLLPSGSVAQLHRIPCAETFHFYMGEPLTVFELHDDGHIKLTILGSDLGAGHRPQYTVPPQVWFGSYPTLDVESYAVDSNSFIKASKRDPELHYSLVGVTCAPAFQFDDCEIGTLDEMSTIAPNAELFIKYLLPQQAEHHL